MRAAGELTHPLNERLARTALRGGVEMVHDLQLRAAGTLPKQQAPQLPLHPVRRGLNGQPCACTPPAYCPHASCPNISHPPCSFSPLPCSCAQ